MCHKEMVCAPQIETRQCQEGQGEEGAGEEQEKKERATWKVLEDNDPSGYKSGAGKDAKAKARIITNDLPKRGPDLNVLDYSLWAYINTKMREQEKAFPANKKESVKQFKDRLRRTALIIPARVVRKAVNDMHARVRKVFDADGGHITE